MARGLRTSRYGSRLPGRHRSAWNPRARNAAANLSRSARSSWSRTGVFGSELRHYRTQAGLSQTELAAKAYVSHDVISKIENEVGKI